MFFKLDTQTYLSSCSVSILVRAGLCCPVKGVVHSIVRYLQFLGNYSHGIAFISQNNNRLMSGMWSVIEHHYIHMNLQVIVQINSQQYLDSIIVKGVI
jgi:hypothetical protein